MYDMQQPSPEFVALGDLVVTGVVRELLPSRWTTPNGREPADLTNLDPGITIVTPVVIDLDQPPLLDLPGHVGTQMRVVLLAEGGTVGRATLTTNGPFNHYSVGTRVVVGAFALDNNDWVVYGAERMRAVPEGYAMGWLPHSRWELSTAESTSTGVSLPLDEFFARLDAAIAARAD